MNRPRVVSITHPDRSPASARLHHLGDLAVTSIVADGAAAAAAGCLRLRASGRGARARFPSLPVAMRLLAPDLVHLRAEPGSSLALQVSRVCARLQLGFVLETERDAAGRSPLASLRSRYVLARAGAAVTRTPQLLASLRRGGFRGVGVVAGPGCPVDPAMSREAGRGLLNVPPGSLIAGWVGGRAERPTLHALLDAMASADGRFVLLVTPDADAAAELADRADALDLLPRLRVLPAAAVDTVASVVDVLVIPGRAALGSDAAYQLEVAQCQGVPVVLDAGAPCAELAGTGCWLVPPRDPAMLARLLGTLEARPDLLAAGAAAAREHAAAMHSPAAAAAGLLQALQAAAAAPARPTGGARRIAGFRFRLGREPSRT